MRLFAALHPPSHVVADADSALAQLRAAHPDIRWVPAVRWHLTLAFYGEVPDGKVDSLKTKVESRARRAPALELALQGAGQFARRALWLGVDGELTRLRALAQSLTFDRRPYRPHLTVARLRNGVDATPVVAALAGYAGPSWVAGSVHLVRSRLGASPTYDDVGSWPLQPRP